MDVKEGKKNIHSVPDADVTSLFECKHRSQSYTVLVAGCECEVTRPLKSLCTPENKKLGADLLLTVSATVWESPQQILFETQHHL